MEGQIIMNIAFHNSFEHNYYYNNYDVIMILAKNGVDF